MASSGAGETECHRLPLRQGKQESEANREREPELKGKSVPVPSPDRHRNDSICQEPPLQHRLISELFLDAEKEISSKLIRVIGPWDRGSTWGGPN